MPSLSVSRRPDKYTPRSGRLAENVINVNCILFPIYLFCFCFYSRIHLHGLVLQVGSAWKNFCQQISFFLQPARTQIFSYHLLPIFRKSHATGLKLPSNRHEASVTPSCFGTSFCFDRVSIKACERNIWTFSQLFLKVLFILFHFGQSVGVSLILLFM